MKFKIVKLNYFGKTIYCIHTSRSSDRGGIACELNILCDQVNEIYKKHGGWRSNYFYDYVFSKKCEVKRVISELESIEILNKLVDNG